MRLALVSFLAALVVAPLAAQAAQPPTRWSVTLTGRVIEDYSYTKATREFECQISRLGQTKRELLFRSLRATTVSVGESGGRVVYRPAALRRVSVRVVPGEGSWIETRRCRADPLERRNGTCRAKPASTRVSSVGFRRWAINRIAFRPRAARPVALCGADRTISPEAWLHLALGRVDEIALARGLRPRVTVRGDATRDGSVVEEGAFTAGQSIRVLWTLRFRRLG